LQYPSGIVAAELITVLHGRRSGAQPTSSFELSGGDKERPVDDENIRSAWGGTDSTNSMAFKWRLLIITMCTTGAFQLFAYFIPGLQRIPIFGGDAATWGFVLALAPAYIGQVRQMLTGCDGLVPPLFMPQGIIVDLRITLSQMAGAILGWGVLGPVFKAKGWASGPINNMETGVQGMLIWIALALVFGDSLTSLSIVVFRYVRSRRAGFGVLQSLPSVAHREVPTWVWLSGLLVSMLVSWIICGTVFSLRWYEPLVGLVLSLLVRAVEHL
jgi:uncharacterized oligopeptide transporter (OPT) family protein